MGRMIELAGIRTWYDEHGQGGEPLVYLHGGFSDAGELEAVRERYTEHFQVFTPERRGHGHTPDTAGPLHFDDLAADLVAFLETVVEGPAHLVGYSDGATTALLTALERPDLVKRMVLISGQFNSDGLLPDMFGDDPARAAADLAQLPLAQRYAGLSPDGGDHFAVVAEKVIRMAMAEPQLKSTELQGIEARTLVVCSDDDVVELEHTIELYRALPDAELAVVPGTSHVLIMEKPELVAQLAIDFLTTDPVATRAPIRRSRG